MKCDLAYCTFVGLTCGMTAMVVVVLQLPLSVVVMASEIRVGMWRRNGQVMFDQMVNYAEPPFCKMFRDMDLLLLQFAGQSVSLLL